MIAVLEWAGVGVFGALGALARFRVDDAVSQRWPIAFPVGTLVINCSGSFVLGVLVGAALGTEPMLIFGTGFIGGYTTFSTWMFESERLIENGEGLLMWGNLLGPMIFGIGFAGLGWLAGASL